MSVLQTSARIHRFSYLSLFRRLRAHQLQQRHRRRRRRRRRRLRRRLRRLRRQLRQQLQQHRRRLQRQQQRVRRQRRRPQRRHDQLFLRITIVQMKTASSQSIRVLLLFTL